MMNGPGPDAEKRTVMSGSRATESAACVTVARIVALLLKASVPMLHVNVRPNCARLSLAALSVQVP